MTLVAHYRMFGQYNAWANGRLYEAAARLSVEQYRADRGAFFKSVHGTLNHQTHHRGQVHAVLTGLVGEAPELDLLFFQRLSAGPDA
jgi:uncharacterized damage-inducible protein DinB